MVEGANRAEYRGERRELLVKWLVAETGRKKKAGHDLPRAPPGPSGLLARLPSGGTRVGLPAREPLGVPFFMFSLSFLGTADAASLISPPEPALSTSLPDPAPLRARFFVGFLAAGPGDMGREAG